MQKPTPEISNVVSTIHMDCEPINIERLSQILPYSSYDRVRFAAVTIRLIEPSCTVLLFCSGKLVVTGSSSAEQSLLSAYHVRDILRECHAGERFEIIAHQIQNIVANVTIPVTHGRRLDIQAFYNDHSAECTYQRSMFPGLIFRSAVCAPVVLLCFSSAKVVITGGKSALDITHAWDHLWPIIQKYVVSE